MKATATATAVVGGYLGEVVLTGPISWLAVGGTEFRIDNIAVLVPELSTPLPGDYNGDLVVDAADYTVWRDHLGLDFDLNGNGNEEGSSAGIVDEADYGTWKSNFGLAGNATESATVPEPSILALALTGLGLLPICPH